MTQHKQTDKAIHLETTMQTAAAQPSAITHPAFAESAANLTDMLRGFVVRWETLDFSVSANCFGLEERMQAWHDAHGPIDLPAAYERQ